MVDYNQATFASFLRACRSVHQVNRLHRLIFQNGRLRVDPFLGNLLVQAYGRCGEVEAAKDAFAAIKQGRNLFTWSLLIREVYAQNGLFSAARAAFDLMPQRDIVACTGMMVALSNNGLLDEVAAVFEVMDERNVVAWTALLQAYARAGQTVRARKIFDEMPERNVVAWSCMLSCGSAGQSFFDQMPAWDTIAWNSRMVSSLADEDYTAANAMFEAAQCRDVVSWNTLVRSLGKQDLLAFTRRAFERMPCWDTVSWVCLVQAMAESSSSSSKDVELFFWSMPCRNLVSWNSIISVSTTVEQAAARFNLCPKWNTVTWNSLIAAYSQMGDLENASRAFASTPQSDEVTWNTLLDATARSGRVGEAMVTMWYMLLDGRYADGSAFLSLMVACSHSGMVDMARDWFISIVADHGLEPGLEHYCSFIDVLARSGRHEEARQLVEMMPFEADQVAVVTLLSRCFETGLE